VPQPHQKNDPMSLHPPSNRDQDKPHTSLQTPPRTRPWAVTASALLLLLQGVSFFVFGLFHFRELNLDWGQPVGVLIFQLLHNLFPGAVFAPLALLALWASIGLMRLWRRAWLDAMLVQGLSLLLALIIYFNQEQAFDYVIMIYGIFMVVYLHTPDIELTFRVRSTLDNPRRRS
jgi:lysylphosphatidylglycerol synthetase-like protein (DUF2156 family)